MGLPYIVPLSPTARFLATQLSTETFIPQVILPKNVLKAFLTSGSTITYNNQISISNSFRRTHKFPASSINYLENKCKLEYTPPANETNDWSCHSPSQNPISLFIPASQLTRLFDPTKNSDATIPPPKSDVFIINPYFGQIEHYQSKLSKYYDNKESIVRSNRPRFWSIISTHLVSNGTHWNINHKGIGELKISYVPFFDNIINGADYDPRYLIDSSETIQHIFNTPTVLPQLYSYANTNILLLEQMIIEASLSLINHKDYLPIFKSMQKLERSVSISSENEIDIYEEQKVQLKQTIFDIIDESVNVLKQHFLVKHFNKLTPTFFATLSKERLFNIALNLIYYDKTISHLNHAIDPIKEVFERKEILKQKAKKRSEYIEVAETFNGRNRDNNKDTKSSRYEDLPLQDIAQFNRQIHRLGKSYRIETPMNSIVCELFDKQDRI